MELNWGKFARNDAVKPSLLGRRVDITAGLPSNGDQVAKVFRGWLFFSAGMDYTLFELVRVNFWTIFPTCSKKPGQNLSELSERALSILCSLFFWEALRDDTKTAAKETRDGLSTQETSIKHYACTTSVQSNFSFQKYLKYGLTLYYVQCPWFQR